jgi:hypothetical protein
MGALSGINDLHIEGCEIQPHLRFCDGCADIFNQNIACF